MLKNGEVDIAYMLDAPSALELKRDPSLRLGFSGAIGVHYLDFFDQWDPKSPWSDRRVRLAANHAIDRRGLIEAETLGASRPTGAWSRARSSSPSRCRHTPTTRRKLSSCSPRPGIRAASTVATSTHSALLVGRGDARQLPRGGGHPDEDAHDGARRLPDGLGRQEAQRHLHVHAGKLRQRGHPAGRGGAERRHVRARRRPDVDALFKQQARETDRRKREAMLHKIQQLVYDRVRFGPLYEFIWPSGIGPRVAEPALLLIDPYPWSAPYEEVRLKGK